MKTTTKIFLYFTLFTFLLESCKVTYQVSYDTLIEGSKDGALQYNDSLVKIVLNPQANGVFFEIENYTKNSLYLIWDKSYFIEPNGGSSKLFNPDIFITTSIIRDKENYESIIPQMGHFARFTASATHLSEFSVFRSSTIFSENPSTIHSNTAYAKFYITGNYWYTGSTRQYSSKKDIPNLDKQEISTVQKFIKNNNQLGLGFTIRDKNKELEYNFKLVFDKAIISKKMPDDFLFTPVYELSKKDGFEPVKIENK
jgi:hypothetical protein